MGTTSFKNVSSIGDPSHGEVIEHNIITYIDWCFLQTGAFYNINIPSSGSYGGDRHRLRPVSDPRYTDGQVWEGYRTNWVWESGTTRDPIAISGVFVDGTFLPRSGDYHINYPDGQVVFDTAISTDSVVQLEYSHKLIKTTSASNVPWFQEGHTRSFRVDDSSFMQGSGFWNQLSQTRVQLPAIAVEVIGTGPYQGYQLGGGQYKRINVLLHVIAEDDSTAKRLASILSEQNDATIYLYDVKRMINNNAFPLDYRGAITANPLTYPDLIAPTGEGGYRYTDKVQYGKIRIYDTNETHSPQHGQISHSVVKWSTETILMNI